VAEQLTLPDLPVRDVMRHDLVTFTPGTLTRTAARVFSDRHISGAPVVDETGRALGVVTLADLNDPDREPRATVGDVMTSFILAVPPDAPLSRAIRLMATDSVHRVFVVEAERVLGVLTSMDILRVLATPPGTENPP
jgi:predicted transcriptional regulator